MIDYAVLPPVIDGKSRPHSRAAESPEYFIRLSVHSAYRRARVIVHDRGGAGLNHLNGGVQGNQAPVNGAAAPAFHDPGLQAAVGSSHLEGGHTAPVVMRVGKARHDQEARAADYLVNLPLPQFFIGAHCFYDAVALQYRAIGYDTAAPTAGSCFADDVSPPNQRRCHSLPLPCRLRL